MLSGNHSKIDLFLSYASFHYYYQAERMTRKKDMKQDKDISRNLVWGGAKLRIKRRM